MESFLDHPDNLRIIPFVPGDYIGYSRMLYVLGKKSNIFQDVPILPVGDNYYQIRPLSTPFTPTFWPLSAIRIPGHVYPWASRSWQTKPWTPSFLPFIKRLAKTTVWVACCKSTTKVDFSDSKPELQKPHNPCSTLGVCKELSNPSKHIIAEIIPYLLKDEWDHRISLPQTCIYLHFVSPFW